MSDFFEDLLRLCILPFSLSDNLIFFVPLACIWVCAGFAVVRRLVSRL